MISGVLVEWISKDLWNQHHCRTVNSK